MKVVALDFESHAIKPRPDYPPKPVGIAMYDNTGQCGYMAFGHPSNNNCEESAAILMTKHLMEEADIILMHNASFDCAILEEQWGLEVPWHKVQCTMVQAFLDNPHGELALKPLSEQLLGVPPTERDAVKDWLIAHGVCRDTKGWGAFIAYAPGDLVGEYAIGDVKRTFDLWEFYNVKSA